MVIYKAQPYCHEALCGIGHMIICHDTLLWTRYKANDEGQIISGLPHFLSKLCSTYVTRLTSSRDVSDTPKLLRPMSTSVSSSSLKRLAYALGWKLRLGSKYVNS